MTIELSRETEAQLEETAQARGVSSISTFRR